MTRSLALLALGAALATAACQRAPEAPAPAPTVVDHLVEARKALAVADWATAAPHLRAALQQDPTSLFLHYNLAICATWLDLRDEAAREFEWVVAHATSDSDEVKTAREWLASRQKKTATETASSPGGGDVGLADSAVHGIVMSGEPGQPATPLGRQQLILSGLRGTPTKDVYRVLRAEDDGSYEVKRLPPGSYKLSDTIGDKPKWRLKVTLEPGQDLLLDLTPDNGVLRRDDFPTGTASDR